MKKIPFPKPPARPLPFPFLSLLFLLPLCVYLATLGPCFLDGDSPETVTAGATLGIPHPPGYALSILTTRLFTLFHLGNPAFAAAVGSSLWASLACLLLFLLQREVQGPARSILVPALLGSFLAFSPHFWQEALSPKGAVYTLQTVLLLVFLGAFLRAGKASLGIFFLGLGLANHWPTQVWFLPLLFWIGLPKGPRSLLRAGSFLCLGLSPLLVLPLLSHLSPALDLGAPDSLHRLVDHLSRKVYSVSREFHELSASGTFLWERTLHLGRHFLSFPLGLALPLGLWGLWAAPRKVKLLAVPLGLLWTALWLYPSTPGTFETLDRFLLPADALLLLFAAVGSLHGLAKVPRRGAAFLAGALGLALLLATAARFPGMDLKDQTLRFDYGMNLLRSAPLGTLLFAEADEDIFTLYYFQETLGKRRDVRMVPSFLLFEEWGVDRMARRFPELGLSGSKAFPSDPLGRMSAATAQLWVLHRDKRPIAFTHFEGALHRYVLPAYPSLRYRRLGLLGALEAKPLGRTSLPGGLRTRGLQGAAVERHPSLAGILQVYRDLGLTP